MNAETRAKELLAAIVERGTGGWRFAAEVEESLPFIATALRQAQNDKLEEAERAILNEHSLAEPDDLNIGLLRAARAVKALRLSTVEKD